MRGGGWRELQTFEVQLLLRKEYHFGTSTSDVTGNLEEGVLVPFSETGTESKHFPSRGLDGDGNNPVPGR